METLLSAELTIPLKQMALLVMLSTMVFLLGKAKLALLLNYIYAFYWCIKADLPLMNDLDPAQLNNAPFLLIGFFFMVVFFVIINMPLSHE
jgi:hypothetical protein